MKAKKKFKASIIIPAWNEKHNIGAVLKKIPKSYEVIVVDDGSTDSTADVVRAFGFEPLVLGKHRGKGAACLAGASIANSEFLIFMDGDGQHDPGEIPKILNALKRNDLVVGVRDYSKLPFHRQVSNKMANAAVKSIIKKDFRDVQCGFRGIRRTALNQLRLGSKGYEFEMDMIIEAAQKRLKICEVPINVLYHSHLGNGRKKKVGSRMSKFSSLKMFAYLVKKVGKHKVI